MTPTQELQKLQATLRQFDQTGDRRGLLPFGLNLTFESSAELRYRRYRDSASQSMQLVAITLVFLLYVCFLWIDSAVGGTLYRQTWLWLVAALLCSPPNIFLLATSLKPERWTWTHPAAFVSSLTNGLGLVIVNALSIHTGLDSLYEIQAMQMLFTFFLLGLRWRAATVVAVVLVLSQIIALQMVGLPVREIFVRVFLLASTALFGGIGCYLQEQTQRLAWLRGEVMQNLSERDGLTGIYNHRTFYDRGALLLRQATRDQLPLSVIVVDVDHFKRFNDTHGHLLGDECLRLVAQTVGQMARRPLDIAARVGGEEFALMLYGVGPDIARRHAKVLCDAVHGLSVRDDIRITVSAGVASTSVEEESSLEVLMDRADRALYRAKASGRDRVMMDGDA